MAAASLTYRLPKDLKGRVRITSAGIRAWNGFAATVEAELAARLQGYEMGGHRSRTLDESLLRKSDLVICMEFDQKKYLITRYPGENSKIFTIGELADRKSSDIDDPYGSDIDVYKSTMSAIDEMLDLAESVIWDMARKNLKS